MTDSLNRLHEAVLAIRIAGSGRSRTAKLLQAGRAKMAKKVAEEAAEVVIDAIGGQRDAVVRESADLLYNLVVLWVSIGVRPQDVWSEMGRRERLLGLAEKMPKTRVPSSERRKVISLQKRRISKSR
ncbi:MAG: phosphoribosyl-ATP diphosphatase [Rhizobiales bacterium]|nr:phosphoribosyl-ATP diphosphatase [Hyphomicrobiales bacterium]